MTPGRARRADPLGGGAAHPVRHQGHVDRLRGAAPAARGRADGSAPRRREEGRDQRLRGDRARGEAEARRSSTSTRSPSRTSSSTSHGLPAGSDDRALNVGAAVSSLNIVSQRRVSAFTREITNAGNTITEEIQRQLGVPFEQAEAYKIGGGATAQSCRSKCTRSSSRRATRSPARSSARSTSISRRAARPRSAASTCAAAARISRRSCRRSRSARACR